MWKCISYSCFARDYTEVFEMCVNKFLFLDFFFVFFGFYQKPILLGANNLFHFFFYCHC